MQPTSGTSWRGRSPCASRRPAPPSPGTRRAPGPSAARGGPPAPGRSLEVVNYSVAVLVEVLVAVLGILVAVLGNMVEGSFGRKSEL